MLRSLYLAFLGHFLCIQGRQLVTVEQTPELPEHWKYSGVAKGGDSITLKVALRQPRIEDLKARLVETSTPNHAELGHHLSKSQLYAYQQPQKGSVDTISEWLESSGVTEIRPHGHWINFNTTVEQARTLLGADLAYYAYGGSEPVLRAQAYTVPADLKQHIDFIFPLGHFMAPVRSRLRSQPLNLDSRPNLASAGEGDYLYCSKGVQPECLKKLYAINYTAPSGPSPSRFGIAGFLEQHISYGDVEGFIAQYGRDIPSNYTFKVELVNNGTNIESEPGMEAVLDVQYGMTIGHPTDVTYYATGGRGGKLDSEGKEIPLSMSDNEPYLEFLQHLLAKEDDQIPHVISISYADDEQGVPRAYAEHVCDLFAQLTARGVSILAATGDGGSRGTGQMQCFSNDGERRRMAIGTFPASCPWVTAVGATHNEGPPVEGATFSTGGFSNYFARPAWQDEAVAGYLTAGLAEDKTKDGMFNRSGRAIPDISAVGAGYVIRWSGRDNGVLGTSASTPVLAAMVALVNDARLRAGKNSTGWLNPLLYSAKMKDAIWDITEGRSQGCWYGDDGTVPGWPAAEGWDAITGLGTPNTFDKFLAALG